MRERKSQRPARSLAMPRATSAPHGRSGHEGILIKLAAFNLFGILETLCNGVFISALPFRADRR
jgi:hypothetical protein